MDNNEILDSWFRNSDCDIFIYESNKKTEKKFAAIAIDHNNDISFKSTGADKYEALSTLKKMISGEYLG